MTHSRAVLCVLACAALLSTPVHAQWKWREAGRVVASDRPPPASVPDRDILQRPASATAPRAPAPMPAATAASAPAGMPGDADLAARKRRADEEQAARRKAEEAATEQKRRADEARLAAQRAENCTLARGALRSLEDGTRVARTLPNGERQVLDDAQRTQEAARLRGVVASDCR